MKIKILLIVIFLNFYLISCQEKNVDGGIWKSEVSGLQISYSKQWDVIVPYLDSNKRTTVGLTDRTDNSSLVVKIANDVSKDQLPDELYYQNIKEQMLTEHSENKLIAEDEIELGGISFHRIIFFMKIKYGDFFTTIYVKRNGAKLNAVQFSYPSSLVVDPEREIPSKFKDLLNGIKF